VAREEHHAHVALGHLLAQPGHPVEEFRPGRLAVGQEFDVDRAEQRAGLLAEDALDRLGILGRVVELQVAGVLRDSHGQHVQCRELDRLGRLVG
jgi:hypothetical protein